MELVLSAQNIFSIIIVFVEVIHESVIQLRKIGDKPTYEINTSSGLTLESTSIIIASGAQARWLDKPNEHKFKGNIFSLAI